MSCWQKGVAMSSIDHKELFEQYYQNEYDFNTASLSLEEVEDIKKLVREKEWIMRWHQWERGCLTGY